MEAVKILIVEDKSVIAHDIAGVLRKNQMEVVGISDSGDEAIRLSESVKPDLVLMDIQLNGAMDGIDAAKIIGQRFNIPVIYLTDFTNKEMVERAKKTHPVNFLSKPFNESELTRSIEIAFYNASQRQIKGRAVSTSVFIRDNNQRYIKVLYHDILFLKAERAYCDVVTEKITLKQTISMNHIHEQLDPEKFLRVHRSFVINIDRVTGVEGNTLFIDKHEIVISPEKRSEVMSHLKFL